MNRRVKTRLHSKTLWSSWPGPRAGNILWDPSADASIDGWDYLAEGVRCRKSGQLLIVIDTYILHVVPTITVHESPAPADQLPALSDPAPDPAPARPSAAAKLAAKNARERLADLPSLTRWRAMAPRWRPSKALFPQPAARLRDSPASASKGNPGNRNDSGLYLTCRRIAGECLRDPIHR